MSGAREERLARASTLAVFLLLWAATLKSTVSAWSHAAGESALTPWLEATYELLKLAMISAFTKAIAKRPPPRRPSREPVAFVSCFVAIAAIGFLQPPSDAAPAAVMIAGQALAVLAGVWMVWAAISLGKCFGVLPEARGLVTGGAYRFVRHPVYLGELGAYLGLALAAPSTMTAIGAVSFFAAQFVRMRLEERALTAEFPEYADYAARTGRVIPRLDAILNPTRTFGQGAAPPLPARIGADA